MKTRARKRIRARYNGYNEKERNWEKKTIGRGRK